MFGGDEPGAITNCHPGAVKTKKLGVEGESSRKERHLPDCFIITAKAALLIPRSDDLREFFLRHARHAHLNHCSRDRLMTFNQITDISGHSNHYQRAVAGVVGQSLD